MIKILFISSYSELYGANRSLLTLLEYFNQKDNYSVKLFIPFGGSIEDELKRKKIQYESLPYFSQLFFYKFKIKYLIQPFLSLLTVLTFPYILYKANRFNPDIIYSNNSPENLGVFISYLLRKKHIYHIREFMDLDFGAKFIGGKTMKKKFINLSQGVIYVSNSIAKWINQGDILPENHIVIYNGINVPSNTFKRNLDKNIINIGIVGILDEAKGQLMAVNHFKYVHEVFPNTILNIYGDKECEYKKKILNAIKTLGLNNSVVLHGFIKDTQKIYSNIDILLMCSRSEGFGRVTVEAMQYGIPVVGYASGGTVEIIKNGINGFLYKTSEDLIIGIGKILQSYDNFSKSAYTISRENYSYERYCNEVEKFILKVM